MTSENQIILLFANKITCQTRTKLFCNSLIKVYDKQEPHYFVIFQYNYMTNENQIILWFPIKLYDKREPNYFVIFQ